MNRISARASCLVLIVIAGGPATANDNALSLSESCETSLALSALPARLRNEAAVYLWTNGEYQMSQGSEEGANFHCFVARNHLRSVIPVCFTRSGVDSVMPGVMYRSKLAMDGMTPDEQEEAFNMKVDAGDFVAPEGPGINYMMSGFTRIYQRAQDALWTAPPHVMYFAPHATAEDVGGATVDYGIQHPGVPVVVDSGIHAYIVTFVETSSDGSAVMADCSAEELNEIVGRAISGSPTDERPTNALAAPLSR